MFHRALLMSTQAVTRSRFQTWSGRIQTHPGMSLWQWTACLKTKPLSVVDTTNTGANPPGLMLSLEVLTPCLHGLVSCCLAYDYKAAVSAPVAAFEACVFFCTD